MSGKSTPKKNITKANKKPGVNDKGRKVLHVLFLLTIGVLFVFNYKASFDPKLDPNGDNINYFLLGKALSEGEGYVDLFPPEPVPHTHFPPGYPMFMSVFMQVFPDNIIAMKILNGLLFLISVLLLFRIVRKATGGNLWLAFAVGIVTVMHSSLLRWSVVMMSEMLYMVISFGIILICLDLDLGKIFTRTGRDWKQVVRLVGLCLLVISSYLVRTMGISVVLSAALAFGVTALKYLLEKDRKWVKPAVVSVMVVLSLVVAHGGWSLRNRLVRPDYKSDYSSGFMYTEDRQRMTPSLWVDRISTNLKVFTGKFIPDSLLRPKEVIDHEKPKKPQTKGVIIGTLMILLMAYGISRMKKGRVLILSYIVITFAVLCLYQEQYAGVRYYIPVLPLMIFAALSGIQGLFVLLSKLAFRKEIAAVGTVAALICSAAVFPSYLKGQQVYKDVASFKTYLEMNPNSDFAHYIMAAEWLKTHAGNNAVVACRKPEVMYIYSGYKHSIMFPLRGDEEEILRFLDESKINCIVVDTWARHAYTVFYPVMSNYPEAFPIYYKTPQDNSPAPTLVARYVPSKIDKANP